MIEREPNTYAAVEFSLNVNEKLVCLSLKTNTE
jgi:hypothetical protein